MKIKSKKRFFIFVFMIICTIGLMAGCMEVKEKPKLTSANLTSQQYEQMLYNMEKQMDALEAKLLIAKRILSLSGRQDIPMHIYAAAQKYTIDPALIAAVIWRESKFNPMARGGDNEAGLMQIHPIHGIKNAWNIKINIMAGSRILKGNIQRFGLYDGLRAYNAGAARMLSNPSVSIAYANDILGIAHDIRGY